MNIINQGRRLCYAAACASLLLASAPAQSSHHFETPLAREFPAFDLTDLYVFEAKTPDHTAFIIDSNPTTGSDGKAKFGENGLYSVHIAEDRALTSGLTLSLRFKDGKAQVGHVDSANPEPGAFGRSLGSIAIGEVGTVDQGIRVWTGAARDPFVGNSAGITAFRAALTAGKLDMSGYAPGVDLFANFNSSVIVLEVPNKLLPKTVHVYATTAMLKDQAWVQVNRLAHPLMTHLFMFDNEPEQFEHVHHRPDSDNERRYVIAGTVLRAAALSGRDQPVAFADEVAKQMLPDLISYTVGTPAHYSYGKLNGRKTTDDSMDTAISIFLGKPVSDQANTFDRHPTEFPYVKVIKPQP